MKAAIGKPEEVAIPSQWLVTTRQHQKTREPSLVNSPLDASRNNRGSVGE
jgi:hypothetical protein